MTAIAPDNTGAASTNPAGGITARQREALAWVEDHLATEGSSPSQAEIGRGLGVSSRRAGFLLRELERRGFVQRGPGYRSVRILTDAAVMVALGAPVALPGGTFWPVGCAS